MKASLGVALLAAGKGTRFKWKSSKVLAPLLGKTVIDFVLDTVDQFARIIQAETQVGYVLGHCFEEVQAQIQQNQTNKYYQESIVHQKQQLGTGHALQTFFDQAKGVTDSEFTLVMYGDTPLIKPDHLLALYTEMKNQQLDAVVASFVPEVAYGYGRIVHGNGTGLRIIEQKNLKADQQEIKEVNSGLYLFKTDFLLRELGKLTTNPVSGEIYLTDLFQDHFKVKAISFNDAESFLGINDLAQLAEATRVLSFRKAQALMADGVRLLDPASVILDWDVSIGSGSTIYPNVVVEGKTRIGENVLLESGVVVKDSSIDRNVSIKAYSYIEESIIDSESVIGPFARLRTGTELGTGVKIGNFVETKKAKLEQGVKVSHLSYVGDAEIGANTNIGCGFITCNYDGAKKHKTKIGAGSFVGSDCQMVAPITVGDKAYIGSGSTINKDVPSGAFAIARERQVNKEGMAKKFLK